MPSNDELHRKMDKALDSGALDTARELMAEDLVAHFYGDNPFAGDLQGRDAFFDTFQRINELSDTFTIQHRDTLSSEQHSAALTTMTITRGGETFEGDVVDLCRWQDGRLVEEWVLPFDQEAFDAFFA